MLVFLMYQVVIFIHSSENFLHIRNFMINSKVSFQKSIINTNGNKIEEYKEVEIESGYLSNKNIKMIGYYRMVGYHLRSQLIGLCRISRNIIWRT